MLAHQAGIDNLNWLSVWSARTVYIFYFEFPTKMIVNKNISSTQKFARNKFKKMRDRKLYLVVISGAFVIPIKSLTAKGSLISKSLSFTLTKIPPKRCQITPLSPFTYRKDAQDSDLALLFGRFELSEIIPPLIQQCFEVWSRVSN